MASEMKDGILDQQLPSPDEAPLTTCPWCGTEHNTMFEDMEDCYETVVEPTPNTCEIARHKKCGHKVRWIETGAYATMEAQNDGDDESNPVSRS